MTNSSATQTTAASATPTNGSKLNAQGDAAKFLIALLTITCIPDDKFWEALNRKDILCPRLVEHAEARSAILTAVTPYLGRGTFEFDSKLFATLDVNAMATLIDYALEKGDEAKREARIAFTPMLFVDAMTAHVSWSVISSGSHLENNAAAVTKALDAIDRLGLLEPKKKMELLGKGKLIHALLSSKTGPAILSEAFRVALELGDDPEPEPFTSGVALKLISNAAIVELFGPKDVFRNIIVRMGRDLKVVPQNWPVEPAQASPPDAATPDIGEDDFGSSADSAAKPNAAAGATTRTGKTLVPPASAPPPPAQSGAHPNGTSEPAETGASSGIHLGP
jgi:hypothetical protein